MDKAAVSRAQQRGVTLNVTSDWRVRKDSVGNTIWSGLVPIKCEAGGDADGFEIVATDLDRFSTPAPIEAIEQWLAELSVISAKRMDDDFSESLRLTAYASRLSTYPADVAKAALFDRTWKFWPTWAELQEECETLAKPRRLMIAAMKHIAPPAEPVEPRISSERAAELMAEMGYTPKRMDMTNG